MEGVSPTLSEPPPVSVETKTTKKQTMREEVGEMTERILRIEVDMDHLRYIAKETEASIQQLNVEKADRKTECSVEELRSKLEAAMEDLCKTMKTLSDKVVESRAIAKNNFHSAENAKSRAGFVSSEVVVLNKRVEEICQTVQGEFGSVTGVIGGLHTDVSYLKTALEKDRTELGRVVECIEAGKKFISVSGIDFENFRASIESRLDSSNIAQKRILTVQANLQRRMQECVSKHEMDDVRRKFMEQSASHQGLRNYVALQAMISNKDKAQGVIDSWVVEKETIMRSSTLSKALQGWSAFLLQRRKLKEALHRTTHQVSKTHIIEYMRSWLHVMHKDSLDKQFSFVNEEVGNQSAQIELLIASSQRHEKSTAELIKQISQRISSLEKVVEKIDNEKISKQMVTEELANLETKMNKDAELRAIFDTLEENKIHLGELRHNKFDVELGEKTQRTLDNVSRDVRKALKNHEERLVHCAAQEMVDTKADTKQVEDVCTLLAQQADQMVSLMTQDMSNIKNSLARFLELSPDIRKSALSVGLEPTDQCVACRAIKRTLVEDVLGDDKNSYRIDPVQSASAQARHILADKCNFPPALATSLAAGATVVSEAVATKNAQGMTPQNRLRQLMSSPAGWLSARQSPVPAAGSVANAPKAVPKTYFPALPQTDRSGDGRPRSGRRLGTGKVC